MSEVGGSVPFTQPARAKATSTNPPGPLLKAGVVLLYSYRTPSGRPPPSTPKQGLRTRSPTRDVNPKLHEALGPVSSPG